MVHPIFVPYFIYCAPNICMYSLTYLHDETKLNNTDVHFDVYNQCVAKNTRFGYNACMKDKRLFIGQYEQH